MRRKLLQYGLATILLSVPFFLLRANLKEPAQHNIVERIVVRALSPVQSVVSWTVDGIGGVWSRYIWLVDVEEENNELRAKVEKLQLENAQLGQRGKNTEELEKLVRLRRQNFGDTVGARVVSSSVNPFFRVQRIKVLQENALLQDGMPVVSHAGLVGRIQSTNGPYAEVLLLSDPQSSIDVKVVRTGGRGVLTGTSDDNSYQSHIEYLEKDQDIREGDEIVTSGLGGAFPPGIRIGFVETISKIEFGLYQKVAVTPSVDIGRLSNVLVLMAPPPPPDPDGGTLLKSKLAHTLDPF